MKTVQRRIAFFLAAILVLTLTGCSFAGVPESKEADQGRLRSLLNEITANLQAGNTPITAGLAADFVSWASSTQLTRQEVAQIAGDWLAAQTPALRQAAEEKLNGLMEQMNKLLKDGAEKVQDASWDLGSVLQDILASGGL